jgi:hypothetical protein
MPCKILFSSRKEVELRERLSGRPQISLDGSHKVEMDIVSYVKAKVKQLRTSDVCLRARIESILAAKTDGENSVPCNCHWSLMFHQACFYGFTLSSRNFGIAIVMLSLKRTRQSSPGVLEKRMISPESCVARILKCSRYGRILDRIMNNNYTRDVAIRILEWMACSFRTLKDYEILDGIAFRPQCTTLSRRTKIDKASL